MRRSEFDVPQDEDPHRECFFIAQDMRTAEVLLGIILRHEVHGRPAIEQLLEQSVVRVDTGIRAIGALGMQERELVPVPTEKALAYLARTPVHGRASGEPNPRCDPTKIVPPDGRRRDSTPKQG